MNYYSLFLTLSQSLQKEISKKNKKRQIKNPQRNQLWTFLNQKVFLQQKKYKIKDKKDIRITIADFVNTLEQVETYCKILHLIRQELANQLRAYAHL